MVGTIFIYMASLLAAQEFAQPRATLAAASPVVSDSLLAKAHQQGSVRVIVQLRGAAVGQPGWEKSVESARQGLLAELTGVAHQVVRHFSAPPSIILEASLAALQILGKSSHVLRVDEDGLAAPMLDSGAPISPIIPLSN
jgi:hypothetical protein